MQTGNISNIKQDVMFQLNIATIEYNIAQKITIKTVSVTVIGSAYWPIIGYITTTADTPPALWLSLIHI